MNDEALFVEQDSILGSELDFPVPRAPIVHGLATVRAVAVCGVGANRKLDLLAQTVVAIPSMLDGRSGGRLEPRVEDEPALADWRG